MPLQVTIRVGRDRHYIAFPTMRIALDGTVVAKLSPRLEIDLFGTGQPQALTATFAGEGSNELIVADPGPHKLVRVRASSVPKWKHTLLFLIGRRVPVYLEIVEKG